MIGLLEKRLAWQDMGVVGNTILRPCFRKFKPLLKSSGVDDPEKKREIWIENSNRQGTNYSRGLKNIGSFYTYLYQALFGGKVRRKDTRYVDKLSYPENENFQPDLIRDDSVYGVVPVETKASSTQLSQFRITGASVENSFCYLIKHMIHAPKRCLPEFAFFKYGDRNIRGTNKLRPKEMVEKLSKEKVEALIVPFNLAVFMLHYARKMDSNKSNSNSGKIERYFYHRTGFFSRLSKGNREFWKIINKHKDGVIWPELVDILSLDKLNFSQTETPPVSVDYYGTHLIPSFKLSKYFLDDSGYEKFRSNFIDNYLYFLKGFGLRDIYSDYLNHLDKKEFFNYLDENFVGDGKKYPRKGIMDFKSDAREEGISFQLAAKVHGYSGKKKRGIKKTSNESEKSGSIPF